MDEIIKWIDLDSLIKRKNGSIDWRKSVGMDVAFTYHTIAGSVRLVEHIKNKKSMRIFIDGYTGDDGYIISCKSLRTCQLGEALSSHISIHKLRTPHPTQKPERTIINSAPHIVQYLVDVNDAYKYSYMSSARITAKCLICGFENKYAIYDLTRRGFTCPNCSDGKSYPNKFMFNILRQLGIEFLYEVTKHNNGFEWVKDYRYDFYFELNNNKYFIEMDGGYHNRQNCIINDQIKDELSLQNGVHMIRINCNYIYTHKRFEYIKENILNSEIAKLFDLSCVDWEYANLNAMHSLVADVARLWEDGLCVADIEKSLPIERHTVREYLKIAGEHNMCSYNKETARERRIESVKSRSGQSRSKPVCMYLHNELIGVFPSAQELSRKSIDVCGVFLNQSPIVAVCSGRKEDYKGYIFKQITKEQYTEYKLAQTAPVY